MSKASGSRQASPSDPVEETPEPRGRDAPEEPTPRQGRAAPSKASLVGYSRAEAFADPSLLPNVRGLPQGVE